MVRLINIMVPLAKQNDVMICLMKLTSHPFIYRLTTFTTLDEKAHFSCKAKDKYIPHIVNQLESIGCGVSYGSIDVVLLLLSKPAINNVHNRHSYRNLPRVTSKDPIPESSKLTIDEVATIIDDGNNLEFAYIGQLICASIISAIGLLSNNSTSILAAMLISPLMGPILSIAFGLTTCDQKTLGTGVRNEVVGIAISLSIGFVAGLIASVYFPPTFRSFEMTSRGQASNLSFSAIVAAASGVSVVLGVSMKGVNALVGTAISASLLPPVVNCGLCFGMALVYSTHYSANEDAVSYAAFGGVSFSLFVVNLAIIITVGYTMLKLLYGKATTVEIANQIETLNVNDELSPV